MRNDSLYKHDPLTKSKNIMKKLILLSGLVFCALSIVAQECFFIQTETRYWDTSSTYDGYTLVWSRWKNIFN